MGIGGTPNGNAALFVGADGLIGIGKTSSGYKLDVAGSVNLDSGNSYFINGANVLSATALGSGVTSSSLTSVGTISTGVWQGSAISSTYLDSSVILVSEIDTSAEIAAIVTNETGTGSLVFSANPTFTGTLNAAAITASGIITGTGSGLTNLNASNLASGTVASARISGAYPGITGVGTIASGTWQGSAIADSYISSAANWNTAYGWGNHATAGYLTGNQTITLSGDVTGSGTTAITTTIGAGKVTNTMLAGSIANSKLANSSITLGTTSISLGGSASTLNGLTSLTVNGIITGTGSGLTNLTAGNLSGTIPSAVLGNSSLYIGTTAIALNRSSAAQTLSGVSISGNAGTASALAADPTDCTAGSGGFALGINASGTAVCSTNGSGLTTLNASNLASGTVASARVSGTYPGITGVGTISNGIWQGSAISSSYLDSAVILQTEIDTSNEIRNIVTDETGSGSLVFNTTPMFSGSILSTGTGYIDPNLGAGTRLLWDTTYGAFRAGDVTGTQWDSANLGDNSVAMGFNTVASGNYSFAVGEGSTASGYAAVSFTKSSATGDYSFAAGRTNLVSGQYSAVFGRNSTVSGHYSFGAGSLLNVSGLYAVATGFQSTASNFYSVAMGNSVTASGESSVAMGVGSAASALGSVAIGNGASASNQYASAIGYQSSASGQASTALGRGVAEGSYAVAIGNIAQASGDYSLAMGSNTSAGGNYSTVMGYQNSASSYMMTAIGQYNVSFGSASSWVSSDPLFVIGNGASDVARSNALTILKNGNMGIGTTNPNQGRIEVYGGTVCVDTNSDNNATSCIANESDERLKTNISTYDNALDTVMALRGVRFDWRVNDANIVTQHPLISRFGDRPQDLGLIAQEVMQIVPEAVSRETIDGFYQLNYDRFIPILIEAVKEQQLQIEDLSIQLDESGELAGSFTAELADFTTQQSSYIESNDTTIEYLLSQTDALTEQMAQLNHVENRILALENSLNASSQKIATLEATLAKLQDTIHVLGEATQSAALATESAGLTATDSAALSEASNSAVLAATSSATLTDLTVTGESAFNNVSVTGQINIDSLGVTSDTNLNNLAVTGNIMAGILSINGFDDEIGTPSASISTIAGPLRLQSDALSELDIMDGRVKIDTRGNVVVKGSITVDKVNVSEESPEDKSIGEGIIPAEQTEIVITTTAVTSNSRIFVTAKSEILMPLSVHNKVDGASFTVRIKEPEDQEIAFDWWVVN